MQKIVFSLLILFLMNACSDDIIEKETIDNNYLAKEVLNSEWHKQGVGPDLWFYRMTVLSAPPNSQALNIADGHYLHPEIIKWEITENMLIGWRAFSSMLNSEHEFHNSVSRNYRGAPVVAYAITSHFDIEPRAKLGNLVGEVIENTDKPWHERKYLRIDWAKNLVSQLGRNDNAQGIASTRMDNVLTHLVDDGNLANPKRNRFSLDYIDFTTRHPVPNSHASTEGAYGRPYKNDTALVVIDIRHFFMRKKNSDFNPLPYPDEVAELAKSHGKVFGKWEHHKSIAVNKRFGMFRTNGDGRPIYDASIGGQNGTVNNATMFNIWEKSKNSDGIIPIEERETKPIIYYTNVLHPDNLWSVSTVAATEWDMAFRSAVYYAQPQKFQTLEDVPAIFLLRKNSCALDNVVNWLTVKRPDLRDSVEGEAKVSMSSVSHALQQANDDQQNRSFSARQSIETNAKRELEKICAALEYFTENSDEKFIYQRPGDLRFNLLNLEVENNTTTWSGYGPMLADPLSGEILSATANINLKYIDRRAQQLSKQIGLLKIKMPGLPAVFGSGSVDEKKQIDNKVRLAIHQRLNDISDAPVFLGGGNFTRMSSNAISNEERKKIKNAMEIIARSMNGEVDNNTEDELDIFVTHDELHVKNPKNAFMDSLKFVDDIAVGVALKFVDLPEHERFLRIRELLTLAVTLHEIGHNVGLRHNMASASDALNYGEHFWQTNQLPRDLSQALVIATGATRGQLQKCLDEEKSVFFGGSGAHNRDITTQDCLQQKNGMYASIMGYHANLANLVGLGLYDKAAIKWSYGNVVEVFPRENLAIDVDKTEIARWLKLHNYQSIPTALLHGIKSIGERAHVKVSWNDGHTLDVFPKNAVPYAYCEDPSGHAGPRCLAYDFGPDMQSSAEWLKSRYFQHYLFTHFADEESWDSSQALLPLSDDIDILNRFTTMLIWYYRQLKEDPDFRGSAAEKDYLRALAVGINHFVHVIGMPESGAHVSAPAWIIEDKLSMPLDTPRLMPTNILMPFNTLSDCNARSVTSVNSEGKTVGRFNFKFTEVPLGLGRPLYSRTSSDEEDPSILYTGTTLVKKYALHLLTAPLWGKTSPENVVKNDVSSVTWYRMFPEIVSKIYASIITRNYQELGPLFVNDLLLLRDVVDEGTLKPLDHKNAVTVQPAIDSSLPLFALENAVRFFPLTSTEEFNLPKSIKITCRGCSDDVDYADVNGGKNIVRFRHLNGQEYKAVRTPDMASIGAELLMEAQRQKERFLKLSECMSSDDVRLSDPFCQCVKTVERREYNQWICCDEKNTTCTGPMLEPVNQGVCTILDLEKRKAQSRDQLDMMTGFIDALRMVLKQAGI